METEIIYMCTPDRWRQIITSLDTLFNSGTTFDRVTVYLLGKKTFEWKFSESSINVEPVSPLFGKSMFGNKIYLCRSNAKRVVFLDADTFVLQKLDSLWEDRHDDLLARVAINYLGAKWNSEIWKSTFSTHGVDKVVPMFNAGVLIFQNGAHKKIECRWKDLITRYVNNEILSPYPRDLSEQSALALAVGIEGLSYSYLDAREHAIGSSVNDPFERAVVYHPGARMYSHYYSLIKSDPHYSAKFVSSFRSPLHIKAKLEDSYLKVKLEVIYKKGISKLNDTQTKLRRYIRRSNEE